MLKTNKIAVLFGVFVMSCSALSADNHIKPNGCKGPSLCSTNPIIDSCGYHIEAGLLLEQMRMYNTYAAVEKVNSARTVDNTGHVDSLKPYSFDLDPGLRLAMGKYFEHDDMFMKLSFEWLSSKGKFSGDLSKQPQSMYLPVIYDDHSHNEGYHSLSAYRNIDYFLLDLTLARGSYLSGKFSISPFAGLKAAWLNSAAKGEFTDLTVTLSSGVWTLHESTYKSCFWGIGPEFGLDINFHICGGWSIYSDSNLSVLVGNQSASATWKHIFSPQVNLVDGQMMKYDNEDMFSPTIRTCIGIQYDKDCYCDTKHIRFRAGFDTRHYLNQLPQICNTGESLGVRKFPGYWGMTGLLLSLGLDY